MEKHRESRIALDPGVLAPHPWGVRDETTDETVGPPPKKAAAKAPAKGKDAKLAAALRANLARRKAAARAVAAPSIPSWNSEKGDG